MTKKLPIVVPMLFVCLFTVEALAQQSYSKEEIAQKIQKLNTLNDEEHRAAVQELAKIGEAAIPDLLEAWRHASYSPIHQGCIEALLLINKPGATVPPLLKAYRQGDHYRLSVYLA